MFINHCNNSQEENNKEEFKYTWNNSQDNSLISFNIGNIDETENEFDGALDLDDLDDFDPRANENIANNVDNDDFDPRGEFN